MSVKRAKVISFLDLRLEEIGQILNFIDSPRVLFSLSGTCKYICGFFRSACVYNKCHNILFKFASNSRIIIHYVTRLQYYIDRYYIDEKEKINFENIPRLEYLDYFNMMERRVIEFPKFPEKLIGLHLYGTIIGESQIKAIKALKELESLSLDSCNVTAKIINDLDLRNLMRLDLQANFLGDKELMKVIFPQRLTSLNLSKNIITDEGLKNILHLKELKELILCWNKIELKGIKSFQFKKLQTLELDGNNIGSEGANNLKIPPSVRNLDLSNNNIGDDGAMNLKIPPGVRNLDLSHNHIGDKGAMNLKIPPGVRNLDLRHNKIGDEGAKNLNLPEGLKYLDLSHNKIGDKGIEDLKIPSSVINLNLIMNINLHQFEYQSLSKRKLPNLKHLLI